MTNVQDVSGDPSMLDWLRHAGHGHLLSQQNQYNNIPARSPSPPIIPSGRISADPHGNSYNHSASFSGAVNANAQSYNHSASFSGAGNANTQAYNHSPPFSGVNNVNAQSYSHSPSFSGVNNINAQSYNGQQSPVNFGQSPTQFIAPHMNQPYDADIEHLRRDPNTRIVQRPPQEDVVYRQRVFMRYLQPPTPPVSGAIIVREKQLPAPPPDPPLVIRRAAPPPPTPPPVVIRERPPPMPLPEPTTVINKFVPAPAKPPRQVIIEQYPPLPPKPQDVIIERWLPTAPRQRRILYERLPAPIINQQTRPIVVQHGQPNVRVQREFHSAPGIQFPYQQTSSHTNLHQVLSQVGGGHQQVHTSLAPSSLISYDPYSAIQQSYGSISQPQSNVVIMQNEQPNIISPSSYGMPLSCTCARNSVVGLGSYGCGTSSVPIVGYSPGQSTVFSVPGNIPVDNVLRQLGIDPCTLRQSSGIINPTSNCMTCVTNVC